MEWNADDKLTFSIYWKMNQRLKYVPATSTHTPVTLRAIPSGVLTCLTRLTPPLIDIADRPIDEIYLDHANALRKAHLAPKTFLTFSKLWEAEADNMVESNGEGRQRARDGFSNNATTHNGKWMGPSQMMFFVVGFSKIWKKPIH